MLYSPAFSDAMHQLRKYKIAPVFVTMLFIIATLLPSLVLLAKASALSDTTPMELVSLAISGNSVDVSVDDGYLEMTGEIFEELSGFQSIEWYYTSPSGEQTVEGDANGDPQYINQLIRFPHFSEPGTWRLTMTLLDVASNSITYTPDELQGLGYNMDVVVTSSPADTTAPSLTSLTLDTNTVDTASQIAVLTGSATISEDLSGLNENELYVIFTSPSGNQRTYGSITSVGNSLVLTTYFQQYSETGVWTMTSSLSDSAGNTRNYDNSDLATLGFPNSVTITGNGDTTPVSVDAMDFTAAFPPAGDQFANSAKVTIAAQYSDNLSGFGVADLVYLSQTSSQIATSSSTFSDNVYQYTVYLPPYAATGTWLPQLTTTDLAGNTRVLSHTDLLGLGYDLTLSVATNEQATVLDNGNVNTDPENDGATPADPFEASVTTPVGGDISITQVALTEPVSSNDYLLFDQQYDINAPTASVESPLILSFRVDASKLGGQTAQTLAVFRNGELIANCLVAGVTDPDACVDERNTLPDGDVELVVRTSHASVWNLGYAAPPEVTYNFSDFDGSVKQAPRFNKIEGGETVPVKFNLTDNTEGLSVLPSNIADSQKISCSTKQPIGETTPIKISKNGELKLKNNGTYSFKWKTLEKWEDSCRQLILHFSNGETIVAYFKFDD